MCQHSALQSAQSGHTHHAVDISVSMYSHCSVFKTLPGGAVRTCRVEQVLRHVRAFGQVLHERLAPRGRLGCAWR